MGSIFDSHAARLSNFGGQDLIAGCRGMKNAPCFWLLTWSRIWFGGSNWGIDLQEGQFGGPFYPSDHPEHQIWGSFSPFRQLGSQIWGVKLDQRPPGRVIWGSFLHHRPVRHPNLGIILVSSTSRKGNLGGQIRPPTSRKANLGGQIRVSTSRRSNLEGRIRLFTCFTQKIFTHYLIVEGIETPIFFENKVIDLLDSLSKGARFGTRVGREWEQEHRFEVLKAWEVKRGASSPLLSG